MEAAVNKRVVLEGCQLTRENTAPAVSWAFNSQLIGQKRALEADGGTGRKEGQPGCVAAILIRHLHPPLLFVPPGESKLKAVYVLSVSNVVPTSKGLVYKNKHSAPNQLIFFACQAELARDKEWPNKNSWQRGFSFLLGEEASPPLGRMRVFFMSGLQVCRVATQHIWWPGVGCPAG